MPLHLSFSLPRRDSVWADQAVMALWVGIGVWLALALTRVPGNVAAVWVSSGIFVGYLLSRPTAQWPGYVTVGFVAELSVRLVSGGSDALSSMLLSICDLFEVLTVAGVVRRFVPDVSDPKGWLSLGGIATSSTLVACALSGLGAAAIVVHVSGSAFPTVFLTWYSAHVVGIVIMATFTLVARREGIGMVEFPGRRLDFFCCMALIALVGIPVFSQSKLPLLFLTYPPLLLGAFRHRFAGVVVGVTVLATIAVVATATGHGPVFIGLPGIGDTMHFVLLQLFIGAACLMTFPVALSMAQRRRLVARLRASEQRYRMLADHSHDVVARMSAGGEVQYLSPSAEEILGWTPDDIRRLGEDIIHPEDRATRRKMLNSVIASGEPAVGPYRVRHRDGHYVWMEVAARAVPDADGGGPSDIVVAARDISERVAAEQALRDSQHELEIQARVDSLTGLANRRQFDERLDRALIRSHRRSLPIALMYMDIDHFKQVNDTLGHAAGDEVLRTFATRLIACVRAGDLVARLGGDEFVVLIEDAALPQAAEVIARKLIATMAVEIKTGESTSSVTTSIGIAYSAAKTTAEALMAAADSALYTAKQSGRNTYHIITLDASAAA